MAPQSGDLITETFAYDGGRQVTVWVPHKPVEAVVFAGDGALIAPWGEFVAETATRSTLLVGVHRAADETRRLHEYSPSFDPALFEAHERFFLDEVGGWVRSRFDVALRRETTAIFGVSAGGKLALAIGLRHPEMFGAILCASPGAGFRPHQPLGAPLPRAYFVAGTEEPFFAENAERWAKAMNEADGEVTMTMREGGHGGPFWRNELPLMIDWAFQ